MSIRKNMLMAETLADLEKFGRATDNTYWCECFEFQHPGGEKKIELCPFHDGFDQGARLGYERGLQHGKNG